MTNSEHFFQIPELASHALETGTITFDNGDRKITLNGIWKCTKECINSKGQRYSEVQVGGIEEESINASEPIKVIYDNMADLEREGSKPNAIRLNAFTLRKLSSLIKFNIYNFNNPETLLGMRIIIDDFLADDECLVYNDNVLFKSDLRKKIFKIGSKKDNSLTLEDCKKAIDTIKDTNSNPIMFPSEIDTLKDLNCKKYSDSVVSLNKDRIVNKHDLKEAVLKSLKRVNESKMWDLIERNAIKIWARDFFNLKDEELK